MKIRLYKEDILSLTDEQTDKLMELWEPKIYDVVLIKEIINDDAEYWESSVADRSINGNLLTLSEIDESYGDTLVEVHTKDCLPLLSIGDLMEILDSNEESIFTMNKFHDSIYQVSINGKSYYGDNKCNALFEALKEVL